MPETCRGTEKMLRGSTTVGRELAATIMTMAVVCLGITVYVSYGAAVVEFTYSVTARDLGEYAPAITVMFRDVSGYAWWLLVFAVVWEVWLLRKPMCTLRCLLWHVGTVVMMTTFWAWFTLLAFYLHNQSFYM